jgi:hypothetical protein
MNAILEFYRLEKPDSEGRMLQQYWSWGHDILERRHDFIQWMFPLAEASAFNRDAPLVTREVSEAFVREPLLQTNLRRSLDVFLNFLGLEYAGGQVAPAVIFEHRLSIWRQTNHNWLRITRLLKSLRLLGLEKECRALWDCLKKLHEEKGYVSDESYYYWLEAMSQPALL